MPLTRRKWNLSIGGGQPLFCTLGLNVLEDTGLALATARHLEPVTDELDLPFVFKASFDHANRSQLKSYRGLGRATGLAMLAKMKAEADVPTAPPLPAGEQADPGGASP